MTLWSNLLLLHPTLKEEEGQTHEDLENLKAVLLHTCSFVPLHLRPRLHMNADALVTRFRCVTRSMTGKHPIETPLTRSHGCLYDNRADLLQPQDGHMCLRRCWERFKRPAYLAKGPRGSPLPANCRTCQASSSYSWFAKPGSKEQVMTLVHDVLLSTLIW